MNSIIDNFPKELDMLSDLYNKHYTEKKDSWQDVSMDYLRHKIIEEFNEYISTPDSSDEEVKELEDLILVSFMLLSRIKKIKYINVDSLYNVILKNRRNTDEKRNQESIEQDSEIKASQE